MRARIEITPEILRLMSPEDRARYETGSPVIADSGAFDKPPAISPLERDEQRSFWQWCCSKGLSDSVVWHSTAHRTKGTLGTPDFIVPIKGDTLYIEFKLPGNKLSFHQERFRASLARQGITLYVVNSALEAQRLIQKNMLCIIL